MKIHYYQSPKGNFGDDLNPWLWKQLLPTLLDETGPTLIGIGSILDRHLIPHESHRKVVFGAGVRSFETIPALDAQSDIRFVRGPLSSEALGGIPFITDSALCLRFCQEPAQVRSSTPVFMLHMNNLWAERLWRLFCFFRGYRYISPRDPIDEIIEAINSTTLVLTEAMHGAIVADALRVPWVHLRISRDLGEGKGVNDFKWQDWTSSLGLVHRPVVIGQLEKPKNLVAGFSAVIQIIGVMTRLLCNLESRGELSDETVLNRKLEQLAQALELLRNDYGPS